MDNHLNAVPRQHLLCSTEDELETQWPVSWLWHICFCTLCLDPWPVPQNHLQLLLHVDAIGHSEVFTYLHSSSSRWKSAVGFLLMRLRQPLLSMYSMLCQVIPSALYSSCRRTHKRCSLVNTEILNVSKATGRGWSRWLRLSTPLDKSWGFRPVDCLSLSSCTGIIGDSVTLETTGGFLVRKTTVRGCLCIAPGPTEVYYPMTKHKSRPCCLL